MSNMNRADHLEAMVKGAEERMLSESCSDQNYAVLGRMRAEFLAQLEALRKPEAGSGSGSQTVDEFTSRRRARGA